MQKFRNLQKNLVNYNPHTYIFAMNKLVKNYIKIDIVINILHELQYIILH